MGYGNATPKSVRKTILTQLLGVVLSIDDLECNMLIQIKNKPGTYRIIALTYTHVHVIHSTSYKFTTYLEVLPENLKVTGRW